MSDWTIIIITLLFSAFSSGSEIAFLSSNKLRIRIDEVREASRQIIWNFVKSPSRFIASMLIANNISLVIYGIVMEKEILQPELLKAYLPIQLHGPGTLLIIQTICSTLIILIAAGFIP
nr:CNNM domain-containing protein [Candidatus Brachybacter algidus]